jgi:hypothetical protein
MTSDELFACMPASGTAAKVVLPPGLIVILLTCDHRHFLSPANALNLST